MSTPAKPAVEKPAEQTPVTPPAAATPPPAEKPAPTPEELEAESKRFMEAAFGEKKPEKKPEPKVEPPPAPAPAAEKKDDPAPAPAEPKDEPKKRFVPKAKKSVTPEEAETIARRVQAEREETPAPEPAPTPEPPTPAPAADDLAGLSDEDQDYLQVIAEVEKNNPAKKGLVEQQKKFFKAVESRRKEWEAKNGEGSYNPDDAEHAEFYRKNEPFVTPRELKAAERSMIAREVEERAVKTAEEKIRKEFEPKLKEFEEEKTRRVVEQKRREIEPIIADAQADVGGAVFQAAPEFKDFVKPKELTGDAVEKMREINPVLHKVVTEEAEIAVAVVGELERLEKLAGHHKWDPHHAERLSNGREIHPHAMINNLFNRLEQVMAKAPKEQRMDEGREWISLDEKLARKDAILKSDAAPAVKNRKLDDLEATTWTITPTHLKQTFLNQTAARVARYSEEFAAYRKAPQAASPSNGSPPPPPTTPPKPSAKSDLPRGTATATVSDTADNSEAARAQVENEDERFRKRHF